MPESIRALQRCRVFEDIDLHLVDLVQRMEPGADPEVLLAVALASREVRYGHVCLELDTSPETLFAERMTPGNKSRMTAVRLPAPEVWCGLLQKAGSVVAVVNPDGGCAESRPLVLDTTNQRLYLVRYWRYEQQVAAALKKLAGPLDTPVWPDDLGARLQALFAGKAAEGADRQRLAAFAALRKRLTVIIGGPGTGKTYTVARILCLLLEAHGSHGRDEPLVVKLAAPTGKAAVRLVESMRHARDELAIDETAGAGIPDTAATIDRLLGYCPGSPYFRHDMTNPLEADIIIVDEASMIDLPKMAKLLGALPDRARLILLGDMNQLASIEAGCVLGDICLAAGVKTFSLDMKREYEAVTGLLVEDEVLDWGGSKGLGDAVIELSFSHRFAPTGSVAALSEAIRVADTPESADRAWQALIRSKPAQEPICWFPLTGGLTDSKGRPLPEFRAAVLEGFGAYLAADTPEQAFAALENFRVLCALRSGPCGVRQVNRLIESVLAGNDLAAGRKFDPRRRFYERRVIMVTRNDYSLGLFNGDIGIVFEDAVDETRKRMSICFQHCSQDGRTGIRRLLPAMLPEHETAFAMTIHKSQGSEFGKVLLVMPPAISQVLSRELIYTGITRTRNAIDLWCSEAVFKAAIMKKTDRSSGLHAALLNCSF